MSKAAVLAAVLLLVLGVARAEDVPVRDPMRPFGAVVAAGGASSVSGPRFAVTGVLIAPSRRIAFLNGQPRKIGDVVDGAEIVAIEAGTVRLRENGAEIVLPLSRRGSVRDPIVQGDSLP